MNSHYNLPPEEKEQATFGACLGGLGGVVGICLGSFLGLFGEVSEVVRGDLGCDIPIQTTMATNTAISCKLTLNTYSVHPNFLSKKGQEKSLSYKCPRLCLASKNEDY